MHEALENLLSLEKQTRLVSCNIFLSSLNKIFWLFFLVMLF